MLKSYAKFTTDTDVHYSDLMKGRKGLVDAAAALQTSSVAFDQLLTKVVGRFCSLPSLDWVHERCTVSTTVDVKSCPFDACLGFS